MRASIPERKKRRERYGIRPSHPGGTQAFLMVFCVHFDVLSSSARDRPFLSSVFRLFNHHSRAAPGQQRSLPIVSTSVESFSSLAASNICPSPLHPSILSDFATATQPYDLPREGPLIFTLSTHTDYCLMRVSITSAIDRWHPYRQSSWSLEETRSSAGPER